MIKVQSVRIRGNQGSIIAEMTESGGWNDPYGGVFTSAEVEDFGAIVRGERTVLVLADEVHFVRVEVLPAALSDG